MLRKSIQYSAVLISSIGLFLGVSGTTQAAPISAMPNTSGSPQLRSCTPGWQFSISSQPENQVFINVERGSTVINLTNNPETYTSSISEDVTTSSTATGTLGGGWGPIDASVGYSADVSQTWTVSESTTITIDPGYEGWNDYGVLRNEWYGDYYYLQSDCTYNSEWIYVYSPRYKAIESHTQVYN
jgi:hypothetical protein